MTVVERIIRKAKFLNGLIRATVLGYFRRGKYRDIRSFLLFIGYPRSGHTLIASLLDAHPEILVSIEWAVLAHLKNGYRKNGIFYSIEKFSRLYTERLSNVWTGYSYRVEGQTQGHSDSIRIIGDKLAGQTSKILIEHPGLLDRLSIETGLGLKLIHVIRNPYDTISTVSRRALEKSPDPTSRPDLEGFSQKYFERVELVESIKKEKRFQVFDLYHEDFIKDPAGGLKELMQFLAIEAEEGYIESCSSIVYQSPNRSREQYTWPDELVADVHDKIKRCEFLKRYTFTD